MSPGNEKFLNHLPLEAEDLLKIKVTSPVKKLFCCLGVAVFTLLLSWPAAAWDIFQKYDKVIWIDQPRQVGLAYDSTMTYADHEGFRCGTCHPFHPFDTAQDRELDLWEVPLVVMDGTLCNYRDLTTEQGAARILELARRCKQVEGTFTLLWHNSSITGSWEEWFDMYARVLKRISQMLGYL